MMPSILTIGNFDGVHIGHRQLISTTIALARSWCGQAIAVTFTPHPRQFFAPIDNFFLYPQNIKKILLNSLGLDDILYLPFKDIYQLTPLQFFENILLPLEPAAIVLGNNFTFGANKAGNLDLLRTFCASHDIALHSLTMTPYKGQPVSSSRIRTAIQQGQITIANEMLGLPYTLYGEIQSGAKRGHTLGFPTANIHPKEQVIPKIGVYATLAQIDGDATIFPSVTAVTQTPTFDQVSPRIETHILGFNRNIYGCQLSVKLIGFIRDEITFTSKEALIAQLQSDCCQARNILGL